MNLQNSITYFKSLIGEQGIIQFTKGYEQDYDFGYAIEDQSRALILAVKLDDVELMEFFYKLIVRSITDKGILMLWNKEGNYQEKIDKEGEGIAEAVWALGYYFDKTKNEEAKKQAESLLRYILVSPHPRAWTYAILGAVKLQNKEITMELAFKLVAGFRNNAKENWRWFEQEMTYGNALFPWSLLEAYSLTNIEVFREMAEESMKFLLDHLINDGRPVVVGFNGWWKRKEKMAKFGQQPIDVSYMVLACLDFYRTTKEEIYKEKAEWYFSWFAGNNVLNLSMIREDGACFDGLWQNGVNTNAGAESNICYLLAAVALEKYN